MPDERWGFKESFGQGAREYQSLQQSVLFGVLAAASRKHESQTLAVL